MCSSLRPAHLLLLDHTLTHHLIHGGLCKGRGDQLPIAIPVGVVGDEGSVSLDVRSELVHGFLQFIHGRAFLVDGLKIHLHIIQHLQGFEHIAVPQRPFDAFKIQGYVLQRANIRQSLRHLFHHRDSHGDVKPVQQMLSRRTEIELQVTDRVATIGEERDRLVHLQSLCLEHLEKASSGFPIISMDGRGRVFDNIFIERLWRSLKYEDAYLKDYQTVMELNAGLDDYFRFYNHERPHQSLENKTPAMVYHGYEYQKTA